MWLYVLIVWLSVHILLTRWWHDTIFYMFATKRYGLQHTCLTPAELKITCAWFRVCSDVNFLQIRFIERGLSKMIAKRSELTKRSFLLRWWHGCLSFYFAKKKMRVAAHLFNVELNRTCVCFQVCSDLKGVTHIRSKRETSTNLGYFRPRQIRIRIRGPV